MTIGTECPHCESVFQVDAALLGKGMRCPNPTCREVFTVSRTASPPTPPAGSAPAAEFMQVYEAEPVGGPGEVLDAEPLPAAKPAPRKVRAAPPIPRAAPLPPAPTVPPAARAPKVTDWSAEEGGPAGGGKPSARKPGSPARKKKDDASDIPIRRRTRGGGGKVVLFSLIAAVLLLVGGTLAFFMLGNRKNEEQAAADAEQTYKEAKYGDAKRKYDNLMTDFPDSSDRDKYQFFSALSQTQADASGVSVKDDPTPAQRSLTAFVSAHGESPLAQPNSGFGGDVVQVGLKVCGAYGDHAADLVKKFQGDRTKLANLDAAEKAVADGRAVIPTVEKFRDKSGVSFDDARKKFDEVEAGVKKERERLAALAPWRTLAADPTDARIDDFEKAMKAAGLEKDEEARRLATDAKTALRKLVVFLTDVAPPVRFTPDAGTALTAAARVSGTPDVRIPVGKQDAVFGIARGVLYALDTRTGNKLWAERVSADARAADAPLRISFPDGTTDWVLVPSVKAGQAAITARNTFTGEVVWHQELPAPVLGRPVRVGGRLFVPLADALGTLVQLDLAVGTIYGRIQLRQPIGGGVAVVRGTNSGHGFLIVPADVRRLFVLEVGKLGDGGRRQAPQVVRVFATNHPRNSLRGTPLVLDPDDPAAPRRVILTQADGPTEMKLKSFALPPIAQLGEPSIDGDSPPDQLAEVAVGGWSWFPPVSDGERVAVCTDTGAFAAFGMNLPGQADKPLYQIPGKTAEADPTAVSRSQVVWMDEDSFWVVANNRLTRLRVSADPLSGQKILPAPDPRVVGEPVAAPQVRVGGGVAVVTTKATERGTIHLQAFDVVSGDEKWRRQLGAVAVAPPFPLPDGGRLVVDECGGIYKSSADDSALTTLEKCEPKNGSVTPAVAAASADGSRVWVACHEPSAEGVKLSVRVVRDGKLDGDERSVSVPAGLAGNAVVVGEHLLFPLANGFLYRLGLKDDEATQGPAWRGAKANADAVCHLTATADGQFIYGDGDTQVFRRKWAVGQAEPEKTGGPWELAGPLSGPPVVVSTDGKEWVIAADASGVAVFDPARPTGDPVKRWQGEANGDLPQGKAGPVGVAGGRAVWAVGGAVAAAGPASDKPDWLFAVPADAGEVVGFTPVPEGVLVSCTSGVVFELSTAGEVRGEAMATPGGSVVTTPAVRTGTADVLLPHADGSTSRLPLKTR